MWNLNKYIHIEKYFINFYVNWLTNGLSFSILNACCYHWNLLWRVDFYFSDMYFTLFEYQNSNKIVWWQRNDRSEEANTSNLHLKLPFQHMFVNIDQILQVFFFVFSAYSIFCKRNEKLCGHLNFNANKFEHFGSFRPIALNCFIKRFQYQVAWATC